MGAGGSVDSSEARPLPERDGKAAASKPGRVRQTILLRDASPPKQPADAAAGSKKPAAEEKKPAYEVTRVRQVRENVFQVQVPPGVAPGGIFSAVCNERYVRIEVPGDCEPGDYIEVDLTDAINQAASDAASAPKPNAAQPAPDVRQLANGGASQQQRLKRAAGLFMKYDTQRKYLLSMTQLEELLQDEFKFAEGSEEIRAEMTYADVDKSQTLTFDEFCHWLEHLELRLELHALKARQQELIEHAQQPGAAAVPDSGAPQAAEEENARRQQVLAEEEMLRLKAEQQRAAFLEEIAALKREKERLEQSKAALETGSDRFAEVADSELRNNAKLRKMEQHQQENEDMIKNLKQDYLALQESQQRAEAETREQHRKKVLKKQEERKRQRKREAKSNDDMDEVRKPSCDDDDDEKPSSKPDAAHIAPAATAVVLSARSNPPVSARAN